MKFGDRLTANWVKITVNVKAERIFFLTLSWRGLLRRSIQSNTVCSLEESFSEDTLVTAETQNQIWLSIFDGAGHIRLKSLVHTCLCESTDARLQTECIRQMKSKERAL